VSSTLPAAAGHYADGVSHTQDARRAITRMAKATEALDAARADRDAAIQAMCREGASPPAIARDLGMSTSNVRLILRDAGLAR